MLHPPATRARGPQALAMGQDGDVGHAWGEFLETLVPRELWARDEMTISVQPPATRTLVAALIPEGR